MQSLKNLLKKLSNIKIPDTQIATPWGLFFLRVAVSIMMLSHGIPKFLSYSEKFHTFQDPLGISSPISLTMAIGAEVFCSLALILGLRPRFAAIPLLFTMLVAAILVHGADPFQKQELPLVYASIFATLMICGGGALQLDTWLMRKAAASRNP